MRILLSIMIPISIFLRVENTLGREGEQAIKPAKKSGEAISFKKDIFPIVNKNCLPCHSEENFNPSELALDDYEKMNTGGKNGPIWVPCKSKESLIIKKLSEEPPFGDRMPLNSKRKVAEGKAKWLTTEEIKKIARWIDEGAKDN